MYNSPFNRIKDPATNKWVNLRGARGLKILSKDIK